MAASFSFQVQPTSGVPIYRQIVDQVRHQVATGRLKPGDSLPSVRQTAKDLQINPMTVSKAYSLLQQEGIAEAVRGQGIRIAKQASVTDPTAQTDALEPLAEQIIATACQLGMSPRQVLRQLQKRMGEMAHESSRSRTR